MPNNLTDEPSPPPSTAVHKTAVGLYLGPKTRSIARPSAASPSGVDVAWAFTYPTDSAESPDSSGTNEFSHRNHERRHRSRNQWANLGLGFVRVGFPQENTRCQHSKKILDGAENVWRLCPPPPWTCWMLDFINNNDGAKDRKKGGGGAGGFPE